MKWDRQALLGDMVRAIRTSRPLVVVSRWQGTPRDGHGQHQAAGLLTPEAVAAAADPRAFPELAREGLRPWRVRKVYSGGWSESDAWHVVIDPGAYDPLIGDSFTNIARAGLSLQRSQTAGRLVRSIRDPARSTTSVATRPTRVKSISSMVCRPPSMPSIG